MTHIPAGWKPIESAPKNQLVMVYTPPQPSDWPDTVRISFDYIDPEVADDYWYNHGEHYEHYCCVAKPENCTGPQERAPYTHWMPLPAAPSPASVAPGDAQDERSPTYGMTLGERIAHVGGRTNAQGYTEFGSPMAVNALIQHVLRDMEWTRQDDDGAYQARYRLPGGQWSTWGHVVCGVMGHEQELRYLPGEHRPAPAAGDARALLDHPLLREVLGYIEDSGPADVWGAAQSWMALRDAASQQQEG
jgi:hypothetical protein